MFSDREDFLFGIRSTPAFRLNAKGVYLRANPTLWLRDQAQTEAQWLEWANARPPLPVGAVDPASILATRSLPGRPSLSTEIYSKGKPQRVELLLRWRGDGDAAEVEVVELLPTAAEPVEFRDAAQRAEALEIALDAIGAGVLCTRSDGGLSLYNQRAVELLELPASILHEHASAHSIFEFQADRGDLDRPAEVLSDQTQTAVTDPRDASAPVTRYVRHLRSGRALEISVRRRADGSAIRTYHDVTAFVRSREALREQATNLQITLDAMDQGISVIDAQGLAILLNRRARELLDLPESVARIGMPMAEIARFQVERGDFAQVPYEADRYASAYAAEGRRLPDDQLPDRYLRRNRKGRLMEIRTHALPDGKVVRTFTDVTEFHDAREALEAREAELRGLVNAIPDRVWVKDTSGVYFMVNPAQAGSIQLRPEDIVGRTDTELYPEAVAASFRQTDLLALQSRTPIVVNIERRAHPGGPDIHEEVIKLAVRDASGRCIGVLGIARDITAHKQVADALRASRDAAEASNRAKALFLANMSHELRTPLNAVIGMTDLLLSTSLSAEQLEYAQTIRTSSQALLAQIRSVLDLSKIESGQVELARAPVDLRACLRDALQITQAAAREKPLSVEVSVHDSVPLHFLGDADRLTEVLVNLVGNAIKFTDRGWVRVNARAEEAARGRLRLHVQVSDSGVGMPNHRLGELFQPFSQIDPSSTRLHGGTGLGLAICRRLLESMGGEIGVRSTPGVGSDFYFHLPVEPVAEPETPVPKPSPLESWAVAAGAADPRAARILLAEDNPTNQRVALLVLERLGYRADAVANGREAVDAVLAAHGQGRPYDLVLMDVQMPVLDGLQAAAQIVGRLPLAERPWMVALTANALQDDRRICLQAGMDDYLSKPIHAQALGEAMQRGLSAGATRRVRPQSPT